ncbi:MAG: phosphoribosylglycinamide formyltransferase [bacterium]
MIDFKKEKMRICFFASHGGSNMQAILDAIQSGLLNAEASLLITNNSQSYAMERAKTVGMSAYHLSGKTNPDNLNSAIIEKLHFHKANIIVLAGYMKKLDDSIIDFVEGRVLNIHPALLPKFGGEGMYGMNVHNAVISAGEKVSGASVHLVNNHYDEGRILNQMKCEVLPDDTPEELAARVLKIEHIIYTDTLIKITIGEIII